MKKIIMITPHLSTGGLPQFLFKKVEALKKKFIVYVVEWQNITGGVLVVQRNLIEQSLGKNFYSLGENKEDIFKIIENIKPDILHFEEFPETFVDEDIAEKIYNNKDYFITETTHGTLFNPKDKRYIPDKMLFVSKENFTQYQSLCGSSDVVHYPISRKSRESSLKKLDLDPSYFHVLNVGLFTPGKNQGEIFKLAERLQKKKVKFHFVGNTAGNFESYWGPLMKEKPENCVIWGERKDTESFYSCMDLFLFTSKLENRPLSVLEAISHDMDVLMYNLPSYGRDFGKFKNVDFLTRSFEANLSLLNKKINHFLGIESVDQILPKITALHILTDVDTEREIRSIQSLCRLEDFGIDYKPIISRRYTELPPAENCQYPERISMEPGGKLTPGHYGCYLGHRKAFEEGIKEESDFILIFECDCVIDVPYNDFIEKLKQAVYHLNKTDLMWFSFGFHNNTNVTEKLSEYWIVDRFYGAHAYLIPKKSYGIFKELYETKKWNVADLFFAENLNQYKAGIFEIPITKQAGGFSILDKIHNDDRY